MGTGCIRRTAVAVVVVVQVVGIGKEAFAEVAAGPVEGSFP